jgi:hypothetical protein
LKSYLARKKEWFAVPLCHANEVLGATYYHFFFAVLLPLLDLARTQYISSNQKILLISCRLFNPLLKEIVAKKIINLQIIPDIEVLRRIENLGADIEYVALDSYETYFFRHGKFCVRPFAGQRFRKISEFTKPFFRDDALKTPAPEVLIINRDRGENGHGSNTRSIPNMEEITAAIRALGLSVESLNLEGKSLAEQIAIFDRAKIVIAQHGSALSNIVWMRPDRARVIEIVPPAFRLPGWQYFELLARQLGIPRIEISTPDPFCPLDVEQILSSVHEFEFSDRIESV